MPMLSLLGANHCLPLFHMPKRSIWLNETKQRINEFTIVYMINKGLNINKASENKWKNLCILHLAKPQNL